MFQVPTQTNACVPEERNIEKGDFQLILVLDDIHNWHIYQC